MSISDSFCCSSCFGWDATSCSFAASRSVRASDSGANTFERRLALLRLMVFARVLFAIVFGGWEMDGVGSRK